MDIFSKSGIGPSLGSELQAAGLQSLNGISWSEKTGILHTNSDVDSNSDELDKIQQVVAAHDPTKSAPPVVPASIPLYKAKIILAQTDMPGNTGQKILDAANAWINQIQDSSKKQVATIAFGEAPELYRTSSILAEVIAGLNLPKDLVDEMFIQAEALQL